MSYYDIRAGHPRMAAARGRKLVVDPNTETLVDDAEANRMLKREYRAPWVVPEQV